MTEHHIKVAMFLFICCGMAGILFLILTAIIIGDAPHDLARHVVPFIALALFGAISCLLAFAYIDFIKRDKND